jgi:hypothetical protein
MRRLALLCCALSSVSLVGCQPIGLPCAQTAQCGGNGTTCLQSGVCAKGCAADSDCAGGEKCSASKGCVPKSGCGADSECATGQVCDGFNCVTDCRTGGGCTNGNVCQANGRCVTPAQAGDGGTGSTSCGGELFQATRVQANMLIVLDKSGSMNESVGNTTKWLAASNALKGVTQQYGTTIRFGLWQFSSPTQCDPGKQYVAVGDNTASAIAAALPAKADGNGTPIGGALEGARKTPELQDTTRANFVVLVTDGKENCKGDPKAAVTSAFGANIKTYVVGFGPSADVDPTLLSEMAVAGGTARNTTPRYYQADDPAALNAAFSSIAQGAIGCDYKLTQVPPDPKKLYVSVNGTLVPNDPNKTAGWNYDSATNRLTLYGPACDLVTQNQNAKVNIVYGCPDQTLLEDPGKKGDGGTINWNLDGGWIN